MVLRRAAPLLSAVVEVGGGCSVAALVTERLSRHLVSGESGGCMSSHVQERTDE